VHEYRSRLCHLWQSTVRDIRRRWYEAIIGLHGWDRRRWRNVRVYVQLQQRGVVRVTEVYYPTVYHVTTTVAHVVVCHAAIVVVVVVVVVNM